MAPHQNLSHWSWPRSLLAKNNFDTKKKLQRWNFEKTASRQVHDLPFSMPLHGFSPNDFTGFQWGFPLFPYTFSIEIMFFSCCTCHGEGDCPMHGKRKKCFNRKKTCFNISINIPSKIHRFFAIISVKRRQKTAPVTWYLHAAMFCEITNVQPSKMRKNVQKKVYLKEKVSMLGNMS